MADKTTKVEDKQSQLEDKLTQLEGKSLKGEDKKFLLKILLYLMPVLAIPQGKYISREIGLKLLPS
ncbi:MAG: hypothetical protein K0S34_1413 [Bacillales bacterium]|jgi:hypothetical protein|nr:hypothetical protein [Bacillales bacterium]